MADFQLGNSIDTTQIRPFLGLTLYYRRFVPVFQDSSPSPFIHLLLKEAPQFKWTNLCQEAFERLKGTGE